MHKLKGSGIIGHILDKDDDIQKIVGKLMTPNFASRFDDYKKRLRWYNGIVMDDLKEMYKAEYRDWDALINCIEFENIIQPIIKKTSLVYKDAPERLAIVEKEEDRDSTKIVKFQELYESIINDSNLNVQMKQINRYTNLLRRIVMKVSHSNGKLVYDIITPDLLHIVVDQKKPLEPIAMLWAADPANAVKVQRDNLGEIEVLLNQDITYEFWSTDDHPLYPCKHFMFKGSGEIIKNKDNPKMENPFKDKDGKSILPLVSFSSEPPTNDWFVQGGDDLMNAQESINKLLTDIQYLAKMQAFSQPVAEGVDTSDVIEVSPSKLLKIPQAQSGESQGTFKFVTPDPKLADLEAILKSKIERVFAQHNINADQFSVSDSSGVALKIRNMALLEDRQDQIDIYRQKEKELFKVMRIVWNFWNPKNKIDEDISIQVDFSEVKFPEDAKAQLENAEKSFTLGLDNPIDWIMRHNPDLTRDQAEAKVLENQQIQKQSTNKFSASIQNVAKEAVKK